MTVQFQRDPFLRKPFYDPYDGWRKDLCSCKEEEQMIYVKTVYEPENHRLPNISGYKNDRQADVFISMCLKWGMGIVSCGKVGEVEARELLANGEAETNDVE